MNKKNIVRIAMTAAGIAIMHTAFYQIVVLMLGLRSMRQLIREKMPWKWSYTALMALCCVCLWITSPRMRWDTSDRVRLVYQDKENKPTWMPLHHWLINTLVPEAEVFNIAMPLVKYSGKLISSFCANTSHANNNLFMQFVEGDPLSKFKQPMRHLKYNGQFVGSGLVPQLFNMIGGDSKATYVISPKNYDPEKTYPVVVNLHGMLGNWTYYQGMMLGCDDHIVISPGTRDWSGFWNHKDLKDVLTTQLALLEELGYKIDRKNVHLIGISNGAYYGASTAVRDFSSSFRSVTFVVGGKTTPKTHPHEMHIYGKLDAACPASLKGIKETKATKDYLYFPCCGHYLMAIHGEEMREWLKERWAAIEGRK